MFSETYTHINALEEDPTKHLDPLNLRRCMRFYPHDQDTGGFFVAVFTKIRGDDEGLIHDELYAMDPWNDARVRQPRILDDLKDFVEEYEGMLKEEEEKSGVPKEKSNQN